MLQISPQSKIFICVEAVDFRKGINGLTAICNLKLEQDPFSGTVFLFRNRRKNAIKAILYDGQGFWLCMKRLSKGTFKWWPTSNADIYMLPANQLPILLWNGNPTKAKLQRDWHSLG